MHVSVNVSYFLFYHFPYSLHLSFNTIVAFSSWDINWGPHPPPPKKKNTKKNKNKQKKTHTQKQQQKNKKQQQQQT